MTPHLSSPKKYLKQSMKCTIKAISEKNRNYLFVDQPKAGRFYLLPKIHKAGNPGRPIVSANGHPTEKISEFVDLHLQPHVHNLPSYLKDTTDFLRKQDAQAPFPPGTLLVSWMSLVDQPKAGRFYLLPKIHKASNPGRPIVSANGHPTEKISEFVDLHLQPHVHNLPSYLKDTTDFLRKQDAQAPINYIYIYIYIY